MEKLQNSTGKLQTQIEKTSVEMEKNSGVYIKSLKFGIYA